MKKIYLFLVSVAILTFSSCEEDSVKALDTSFASFTSKTMDIGIEEDGETSREIKIYTTNITSSAREIPVLVVEESTDVDPGAYTIPSTVTIPGGSNVGTLKIDVKDVGLELAPDKYLTIRLENTDVISTGEALKIGLSQLCPGATVKLKVNLSFDKWPEEAAWVIKDSDGNTVLASAIPLAFGAYAGLTDSLTIAECLASGTYTIQVYDQYGDAGTDYELTANGIQVLTIDGDYEGGTTVTFTI